MQEDNKPDAPRATAKPAARDGAVLPLGRYGQGVYGQCRSATDAEIAAQAETPAVTPKTAQE